MFLEIKLLLDVELKKKTIFFFFLKNILDWVTEISKTTNLFVSFFLKLSVFFQLIWFYKYK